MNIESLPVGTNPKAVKFPHFPIAHQAVIWRNWKLVPIENIAAVLNTTEQNILKAAEKIGLPVPPHVNDMWLTRGYITIIRANWHLLPYEQLVQLLGMTPEKLAYILKEDDFLWIKLGSLKPAAEPVYFRNLNTEETDQTAQIKATVQKHFPDLKQKDSPFSFVKKFEAIDKNNTSYNTFKKQFNPQFIYSYSAVYGDTLLNPDITPFPDGMLKRYSDMGITGVWLQGILYTLYPFKNAPEFSIGWEKRLETLRTLVANAGKYGIGIYLYINEPRGMPEKFFEKYPEWKGVYEKSTGNYALCTSRKGVLEYLKDACAHVFREVPGLTGAFTISMSENITHCHARWNGQDCPLCSQRKASDIVAEVNCAIEKGIHSESPSARVIAWNWAWAPEWEHDVIDKLPLKTELMCVSEWGKQIEIGGVKNEVVDYSISQPGPSRKHIELWEHAKKRGLKTIAKVQINNSWECSAVPYIPVPYLVEKHLNRLKKAGVDGLMASWTLGGYPGGNLELLGQTTEKLAFAKFGKNAASQIISAWKFFSNAFTNFPFHFEVLYNGPQTYGPMSLLYPEPTGYKATMQGFPYDDLDGWRVNYPEEIFERQFKKLSEKWKKGLDVLSAAGEYVDKDKKDNYADLKNVSTAVYCHFRSSYLQTRFVRIRKNKDKKSLAEIKSILNEEIKLAKMLHAIVLNDSRIGFEASNHYFYTANDLREKILNCEYLKSQMKMKKNNH